MHILKKRMAEVTIVKILVAVQNHSVSECIVHKVGPQ
jgi:hypothetical protein